MSDYGVFESIDGSSSEKKIATRETQRKLDAAIDAVKGQYGTFLYASRDAEEFNDRVALCKNDMIKTIDAHLMPVTGVVRRVVKACKDDWKQRQAWDQKMVDEWADHHGGNSKDGHGGKHRMNGEPNEISVKEIQFRRADKTGPAMDIAAPFPKKKDKDLKPKGDFDAYLNKVDQNSDAAVDNCFKESRYYYADNGVGAVPQNTPAPGTGDPVPDPVSQAAGVPQGIPGIQASRYFLATDDEVPPGFKKVPGGAPGTQLYRTLPDMESYGNRGIQVGPNGDKREVSFSGGASQGQVGNQYDYRGGQFTPDELKNFSGKAPASAPSDSSAAYRHIGPAAGANPDGSPSASKAGPSALGKAPGGAPPVAAPAAAPAAAGTGGNAGGGSKGSGAGGGTNGGGGTGGGGWSANSDMSKIGPGEYTIQSGDTYSNLAQRAGWGDDYKGFSKAVGYQADNPDKIFAGDKINVVGKPGSDAASASGADAAAPKAEAPKTEFGAGGLSTDNGFAGGAPGLTTTPPPAAPSAGQPIKSSLALNQYMDWCDSFGYRRASMNNLDIYAQNLNDRAYFEIASAITDPSSPIYIEASGYDSIDSQLVNVDPELAKERMHQRQPSRSLPAPEKAFHSPGVGGPGKNKGAVAGGIKVNPDSLKRQMGKNAAYLRTAAPDYLQKADEALTNLLNQKAEEFQETIAPLQQALQTVQQAEALQQAQNPLGVQPPAGTVNVLPGGGDPSGGAGGGGGGEDPMAAAMTLAGGGGGGGMPPGGGDPSMGGGDPSQMQMQARRRRAADGYDNKREVARKFAGPAKGGFGHGDIVTHAGGDPRAVVPIEGGNPALRGIVVGGPVVLGPSGKPGHLVNWEGEGHPMFGQFGGGGSYHHPEELVATGERQELNPDGSDPRVKPWPYGDYGREAKRGGHPKARGANSPKTADVAGSFDKWMKNRGPGAVQGPTDVQDFAEQQGYSQKGQNYLQNHVGPDALLDSAKPKKNPMRQVRGRRKQADFFTRKVAGWQWDSHLNGYVASKPTPFTCKCGAKHEVPSYAQCKCGKIFNSYVIGTGGDNRQASADKYICREVPVRDNVIVARRRRASNIPLNVTDSAPPRDKPVILTFGGAFNPVHSGHVQALQDAHDALAGAGYKVEGSIVSPTADKLLAKKLDLPDRLGLRDRVAVSKTAFPTHMNGAPLIVTPEPSEEVERALGKPRRSDLANWAQRRYPNHAIVNVSGEDALVPGAPDVHPSLYSGALGSGHEGINYLTLPRDPDESMSSSKIRAALAAGLPIPGMTPESEQAYRETLARHRESIPSNKHVRQQTGFGKTIDVVRDPGDYEGRHRAARRYFQKIVAEKELSIPKDTIVKYTEDEDDRGAWPKKASCNCWKGYERVPGTKPCSPGSCRKCDSHSKKESGKVKRHNLSDPGPLNEGKDDKMPSINEDLGKEWYRHGPGGKWVAKKKNRRR